MGVLGMSLDDWGQLSPDEFEACWHAHTDESEQAERSKWERMRLLAAIVVQPHCKKKLTAKALLPFPWDDEGKRKALRESAPKMTKEERRARMERLREKLGG